MSTTFIVFFFRNVLYLRQYKKARYFDTFCVRKGIKMAPNESAENYLETILILSRKLPVVRSVDIANELGFKKSSISIAMKNLREKELITVSDAGFINLTEAGREIADMIYERHEFLTSWLTHLGVDPEVAAEDACKMEHVVSKESFQAIKNFVASAQTES